MNPIENLWAIIKQKLKGFEAKNADELFKKFKRYDTVFLQKHVKD